MAKTPKNADRATDPVSEGMALLRAPDGVTGASAGGVEYLVGEDGVLAVAPEHVPLLLEHGFTAVE